MSADGWSVCQRCKRIASEKTASLYGKVSESEYLAYVKREGERDEFTLREDYEIYITEKGEFVVAYTCSCSECGFEFNYDHHESLEI